MSLETASSQAPDLRTRLESQIHCFTIAPCGGQKPSPELGEPARARLLSHVESRTGRWTAGSGWKRCCGHRLAPRVQHPGQCSKPGDWDGSQGGTAGTLSTTPACRQPRSHRCQGALEGAGTATPGRRKATEITRVGEPQGWCAFSGSSGT